MILINILILLAAIFLTKFALSRGNRSLALENSITVFHLVQSSYLVVYAGFSLWILTQFWIGFAAGVYFCFSIFSAHDWNNFFKNINKRGILASGLMAVFATAFGMFKSNVVTPLVEGVQEEMSSVKSLILGEKRASDLAIRNLGNTIDLTGLFIYKFSHIVCSILAIIVLSSIAYW
jgi:hypothetical protein